MRAPQTFGSGQCYWSMARLISDSRHAFTRFCLYAYAYPNSPECYPWNTVYVNLNLYGGPFARAAAPAAAICGISYCSMRLALALAQRLK